MPPLNNIEEVYVEIEKSQINRNLRHLFYVSVINIEKYPKPKNPL